MDCNSCEWIGYSGNHKVCGYLLESGETCFVHDGKISEVCPIEALNKIIKNQIEALYDYNIL